MTTSVRRRCPDVVPPLARIVSPDSGLLWLGVAFVLSVYYFPSGIIGRLRRLGTQRPA